MFICIAGLGLLVASDEITKKDWTAVARGKGDGFMIAGATLYGFSMFSVGCPSKKRLMAHIANATEEFFVRKRPLYEVSFFLFPSNLVAIGK